MDVVNRVRAEQVRILAEPVVKVRAAHREIKAAAPGVELLAGILELAREVELPIGVADGAGVAAEVFFVGVREGRGNRKRNRADAEREYGAVRNLVHHELRNSSVNLRRRAVSALG